MKTNKFNWMAVVLLPLMFLCTACNEDVSDGVVTVKLRNDGGGFPLCGTYVRMSSSNNFYLYSYDHRYQYEGEFVDMGTKRISQIKNIPTQGWAESVAILPGHGYIFRARPQSAYYGYNEYQYGRIYVVGYTESASSGGIIGAEIKYKESSTPGALD